MGKTSTWMLLLLFALPARMVAQEQQAKAGGQGGVSDKQMTDANNPLASMNSLNFHNYFVPELYGVPDVSTNTMNVRGVVVSGRHIIRATLPIATAPVGRSSVSIPGLGTLPDVTLPIGPVQYRSGLGDFAIFDAIKLRSEDAKTQVGVGPLLVAPTATNSALGAGKWQAGAALVAIHPIPGGSMAGALVTWQHSFAGDKDRPTAHVGTFQPVLTMSIGGGYYLRSAGAVWVFDFENNRYLIPMGLGAGKVFPLGSAIANVFLEPQFTVYHKGAGLPSFQLFFGLNLQWSTQNSP